MSKHPTISKSKTLDVPIIITSAITEPKNEPPQPILSPTKYKLDKAYSLDSQYSSHQSSFSSINSVSINDSCSNNSINQFQYYRQQFLTPPPAISFANNINNNNSPSNMEKINADFKSNQ